MNLFQLMPHLGQLGLGWVVDGDRPLIFCRRTVTADPLRRQKAPEAELMAVPRNMAGMVPLALERDPISERANSYGWPVDSIDPDEPAPCARCGTLELWQSVAGELFGPTPGRWRCMKCDPPTAAQRLAKAADLIRRRVHRTITTRQND